MTEAKNEPAREGRCGCGSLTVAAVGEPLEVYACSCLNCQRESGGAFSYSAVFPEAAVSLEGPRQVWRRTGDSGRWLETDFCPTCGVTLCARLEAWPETVGVSVGCFADPDFVKPEKVYWASRRHHWLDFPECTELIQPQTD